MAKLTDVKFWLSLILAFTADEDRREAVIARMCKRPGMDRARVEHVLELVRGAVEGDAPAEVPEATPELRLEIARRVAELSGKTVEEVLEEDLSA